MSKVIGVRIGDELFEKIKADSRTNSEILETALIEHYNQDIKTMLTPLEPDFYRSWYYDLYLQLKRFEGV